MKITAKEYRVISLIFLAPFWLVILSLIAVYALLVWLVGIIRTIAGNKPSFTTPYDPGKVTPNSGFTPIVNNIYANGLANPYAAYLQRGENPGSVVNNSTSTVNNYYLNQEKKETPKPAPKEWGPTFVANPQARVIDNADPTKTLPENQATVNLPDPDARPALPNREATATYSFEDDFGRKRGEHHG